MQGEVQEEDSTGQEVEKTIDDSAERQRKNGGLKIKPMPVKQVL